MFGVKAIGSPEGGDGVSGSGGKECDEGVEARRVSRESAGAINRVRVDSEVDFSDLASRSEGYSGADIRLIVKEAAMRPLRRMMSSLESLDDNLGGNAAETLLVKLGPVGASDLEAALRVTKPSSGFKSELYTKWQDEHGSS